MAIQDFWLNIQRAARLIHPSVDSDSAHVNADELADQLQRSALWLTRSAVTGFRADEFDFLSEDDLNKLSESVDRFREIAGQVGQNPKLTEAQFQSADGAFKQILAILRLDKYSDPVAFECGKKMEGYLTGRLPDSVRDLRFRADEDWQGQPGLWITVIFKRGHANDDARLVTEADKARRLMYEAVEELGIDRWPFTRFATEEDLDESEREDAGNVAAR